MRRKFMKPKKKSSVGKAKVKRSKKTTVKPKVPIYTMEQTLEDQIKSYKKYIRSKINRTKVNAIGFVSPEYFGCCNSGATIRLTYHPQYGIFVGLGDNRYGFTYSKMVSKVPSSIKVQRECVVKFSHDEKVKAINYFFKLTKRIMKFNKEAHDEAKQLREKLKTNPGDVGAMLDLYDLTG